MTDLGELNLSARTINAIERNSLWIIDRQPNPPPNINSIERLCALSAYDLARMQGIGLGSLKEIMTALDTHGLRLKESDRLFSSNEISKFIREFKWTQQKHVDAHKRK